ncbi:MAG: cyclopropane-fatty-acyl-phospholipid synthase family protein [Pseudomonadota bacterium]
MDIVDKQKSLSLTNFLLNKNYWSFHKIVANLQKINKGHLTLILPDKSQIAFVGRENENQSAVLEIKKWSVFYSILLRGEIGFAEAYMRGEWSSPDLVELFKMLINNQESLKISQRPLFILNWLIKIQDWLLKNTPKQSLNNIKKHYDLGNDFYQLWLDSSMNYSCALFQGKNATLEEAQRAKYNRILDRLNPKRGERILDIGCGWGGFAEAASARGCEIKGVTLSDEQLIYAKKRAEKFSIKSTFENQDYRDLTGQYNYIVSIGMFEHVGREYWSQYFKKIYELLKPGGKAMIQSIVYTAKDYSDYIKSTSFIRLYIFPGGFLPTPESIENSAIQSGLIVTNKFDFGLDYAKTLSLWKDRFLKAESEIYKLGFDDKFKRLWLYYLCLSEASFLTHEISVMQVALIKPDS